MNLEGSFPCPGLTSFKAPWSLHPQLPQDAQLGSDLMLLEAVTSEAPGRVGSLLGWRPWSTWL